jgi:hypothetical protein
MTVMIGIDRPAAERLGSRGVLLHMCSGTRRPVALPTGASPCRPLRLPSATIRRSISAPTPTFHTGNLRSAADGMDGVRTEAYKERREEPTVYVRERPRPR